LEQHDLSNQSLKLAVGMDRVGYLVWRVRDALPARRVNSAKMEEFTVELTEFVSYLM
jgi:hypothetical protein